MDEMDGEFDKANPTAARIVDEVDHAVLSVHGAFTSAEDLQDFLAGKLEIDQQEVTDHVRKLVNVKLAEVQSKSPDN
jgi:hypothetical protein